MPLLYFTKVISSADPQKFERQPTYVSSFGSSMESRYTIISNKLLFIIVTSLSLLQCALDEA